MREAFQFWVEYDRDATWHMLYMHYDKEKVKKHLEEVMNDVETPCIGDWYIIRVEVVK